MNIHITGMGWVYNSCMGYKNNIQEFDSKKNLPSITRKGILKEPYKPLGRMDDFSKVGFAAIVFAMQDAKRHTAPHKNTAIIASSSTGCLETDLKYQATLLRENNTFPSPAIFAYTLPSCFLGEASIFFGLTGENFIINEENTTGMTGLGMAVDLLELQQADMVLCGINNSEINNFEDGTNFIKSGAVFFLLENKKTKRTGSYGELHLNSSNNEFYFQKNTQKDNHDVNPESKIDNLYNLAQKCLKRKI
ncbi:MAG: beta-ketoacyl synthase N-terminal-like domain-containing protein [Pseudomonadota bacterium]